MNLWVRTLRQLTVLAVALFFFSCEDETSILGFKNPNQKFKVGFVEIPLNTSSVLAIDSLVTDLRPLVQNGQTVQVDGILVGEYQDPALGKVSARSFLTIYSTANTALDATAVYDSITVQFRLNFYSYGLTGTQEQRFAVHEITGDTLTLYNGNRYYANSPAPQYSVDPLGEAVVSVNYDSLLKQAALSSRQDTLFAKAKLTDEFGKRVFDAVKGGLSDTGAHKLFKSQIRGLAIVPASTPGVLGLNVLNDFGQLSRVFVHYHTLDETGAVEDTLSRALGFEYASFTNIEADRTGTELQGLQPYVSAEPLSGLRYVQSGAPILTKIDLAPFYSFADTVDNILINSAEFVITNVETPDGSRPIRSFMFRLMHNDTDLFLNSRVAADRDLLANSRYYILGSENYYIPSTDGSGAVTVNYDDDENRYAGFMTLFAQSLFVNSSDADGVNEDRLKYLALYPLNPNPARSVSRTVFSKDNVNLRIFYTRANTVTP